MSWKWRQGFSWILKVNLIFLAIDALLLPLLTLFSKTDIFTIISEWLFFNNAAS